MQGWFSLVTGACAYSARGGRAWKGDTSHVLAFHLGYCPDQSGQGSRGRGNRGAVEAVGPAFRQGCLHGGKGWGVETFRDHQPAFPLVSV